MREGTLDGALIQYQLSFRLIFGYNSQLANDMEDQSLRPLPNPVAGD